VTRLRFTQTLLARFLLIAFGTIVLGAVLRYVQFSGFLRDEIIDGVSKQQTALASYVAADVDSQLELRRGALRRLATALPLELLPQEAGTRQWLAQQQATLPLFSQGLLLADASGRVLVDQPQGLGRAGSSLADDAAFQAALAGQVALGRPGTDAGSQQPVLSMAAPVSGPDGRVRAVLVGLVNLSSNGFLGRLMASRVGASGGLLLVSPADKLLLAASDPALAFHPTPPPGSNALNDQRMQQGYRGPGISTNSAGVEEISAAASVPSTGWYVLAHMPTQEALATVSHARARLIWQTILIALLVLAGVSALFVWVMRPLYQTAMLAERMTRGELPLAPLPVPRADEVGHLTAAFNRLLDKVESQKASLLLMANQDVLTGLPNRKLLADRLHLALARAQRHGGGVAVLFMDLNGFKAINDSFGHDAGDEVLMEVALRLNRVVRQSDTLARLGGDEFVLLATDLEADPAPALATLANKCIDAVQRPMQVQGQPRSLGVAVGIAVAGKGSTADSLLSAADKAMYQAKQQGESAFMAAPAQA
jgi:diguanylate cyclase (GGDEF)-like protein